MLTPDQHGELQGLPPDWELLRLGELFDASAGGDFDPDCSSMFRSDRHSYPIYANGLSKRGLYAFCNQAAVPAGSITITARGTLGRAFYRDTPFVAIGRLLVLRPRMDMDARFFADYINQCVSFVVESTGVPQLTAPKIAQHLLPVPPEAEQRAISDALSDADNLIEALEALIAKKRALTRSVSQRLLTGKTRLPGFGGTWKTALIDDIAAIRDHRVLPSTVAPATPCIELDHIEQASGRLASRSTAKQSISLKYIFQSGDVLFGRLRPYLRKYWRADCDGICTTEIWPLTPKRDRVDGGFLYAIVQSERFVNLANVAYGTHMPRADWSLLRNLQIPLPSAREQRAITGVLADMDADVAAIQQRLDKTRAIKQGLMQQLLTGRVRLLQPA